MTQQPKSIADLRGENLTNIRAYASIISPDNWRDIQLRIEIEFSALAATYAEIVGSSK